MRLRLAAPILALAALAACAEDPTPAAYAWTLPAHFPAPAVPADNPMSPQKAELGRHLFYDGRLSITGTVSCASCHEQRLAFTDGKAKAEGATGEITPRGSMSLTNVAYAPRLTWASPLVDRLEHQALLPMFGEAPVEMGLAGREDALLATLRADPVYQGLFRLAWPADADPFTLERVVQAIASFQRTLISADSPYDRFVAGDTKALTAQQQRGMALFMSERLECFHCHGGFNFTDAVDHQGKAEAEIAFHNTGLYDLDGQGAYPAPNTGLHAVTGRAEDMGRFRAPTLRNIAVTAPYMHDGSVATLGEVIDHYAQGGRAGGPLVSAFVPGFVISDAERADLIAFLDSLTDEGFLTDPRFADPWAAP